MIKKIMMAITGMMMFVIPVEAEAISLPVTVVVEGNRDDLPSTVKISAITENAPMPKEVELHYVGTQTKAYEEFEIDASQLGNYAYRIEIEEESYDRIVYDKDYYVVYMTSYVDQNDEIHAEFNAYRNNQENNKQDAIQFTNVVKSDPIITPVPKPEQNSVFIPNTGDTFEVRIYLLAITVSVLGLLLLLLFKIRQHKNDHH